MKLALRHGYLEQEGPLIMGILNVTPDSFSDGGRFLGMDEALRQAGRMAEAGADIIDVGGESTRPGAAAVGEEEECDRILPVIERIKEEYNVLVSVDTYKESVARLAVEEAGADMINDISGFAFSDAMAETVARLDVPVVLMHIKGSPETMQQNPYYHDVVAEVQEYFAQRLEFAAGRGVKREKIILDPGIGFGKRLEDNVRLLRELSVFRAFDLPLLVGVSRKGFLGRLSGMNDAAARDVETVTANVLAVLHGADILRVHNVEFARRSLKILKSLL